MTEYRMCTHRELAVGWALHSLEPAEEAAFAAHLPGCADCDRTVRESEQVGIALASLVPDVAPRDELRQRVLDAASATPFPLAPPVEHVVTRSTDGVVVPLRRRRSARVLTAAAAVVFVGVAGVLGVRVAQIDGDRDAAVAQVSEMRDTMDRVADPNLNRVPLVDSAGRPVGMVMSGDGSATIVPMHLAPNDVQNQTYVLWGLVRGTPVPLAGFDVSADGDPAKTVSSGSEAGTYTGYAVSLEQGRTLPASPTEVLASGQVAS